MSQAIELVIFQAREGVSEERLQAASMGINVVLQAMPGFVSREFGRDENEHYVDIVHWEDMDSAKQAAQKVMSIPTCLEYFDLIEQSQMSFWHFHRQM